MQRIGGTGPQPDPAIAVLFGADRRVAHRGGAVVGVRGVLAHYDEAPLVVDEKRHARVMRTRLRVERSSVTAVERETGGGVPVEG